MATARPFAYNTGAPISGTIQVGDLSVGTPTSGFTSSPQYWNGPDEDLGYVIAVPVSGNTQPTEISGITASVGFFRTIGFTDSEFIQLSEIVSNEFGNPQTFLTAQDASDWLTTNGFWNSYGPVVGGLEVYLDAGNSSSYSGSGSVWYDLTNNSNNATLINSPTYSSSYGGIIQFDDASLEYGTIPNIGDLPNWTIEVWFRLTTSLNGKVTSIVSNQFDLSNKLNYSIGTNNAPTNYNLAPGFFDSNGWHNTTGISPQTNVWYQVVGTYDGSVIREYVNGVASGGTNNYVGTPQSGGEIRLMRRWDSAIQQGNLVDGDLAIVRIYSRALSDSEILLNYDFDSSRFVVTTPTPTPTTTQTPTPSVTVSQTVTSTVTPTPTISNTPTTTPTPTPTITSTVTPTISLTPTTTPTPTPTEPFFLLFEDGSIATAENNDNIEIDTI